MAISPFAVSSGLGLLAVAKLLPMQALKFCSQGMVLTSYLEDTRGMNTYLWQIIGHLFQLHQNLIFLFKIIK